ncbi:hypothetical protein FB157_14136 [Streptomyces sp. BK340]|nr:hypothetical protein FB157_14136 [Streptomyces sp. BK340]
MSRVAVVQEPVALAVLQELVGLVLAEAVRLSEFGDQHRAKLVRS